MLQEYSRSYKSEHDKLTRQPLWFGPPERRLFGWLHLPPSGQAAVGIVLCPSLSVEAVSAGPALRRLADLVANAGMVALRFDYEGTGNSSGWNGDPDRVNAWKASVHHAIRFIHELGLRIGIVGLRMGGTLAASSLDETSLPVDSLVLWDPCSSGRAFLRQQQLLSSRVIHRPARSDGAVETLGMLFGPDTVNDLSGLRIDKTIGLLASRVLVLARVDRRVDQSIAERLSLPHVTWGTVDGQSSLVDVEPFAAKIPEADLQKIVTWLSATASANLLPVRREHCTRAIVSENEHGAPVIEYPISLAAGELFGIITDSEDNTKIGRDLTDDSFPIIVFLNAGVIDHVGPARLWVEWSRRWAALGLRCVRFDLPGNGESSELNAQSNAPVTESNISDHLDQVLAELTNGNPSNAVLVGMCSGGFHAFQTARRYQLSGICTVNPNLLINVHKCKSCADNRWKFYLTIALINIMKRLLPGRHIRSAAVERLPSSAWWIVKHLVCVDLPAMVALEVASKGTPVFVAVNKSDARLLRLGGQFALAQAARRGTYTVGIVDEMDHTLFGSSAREHTSELITAYIRERFAGYRDQKCYKSRELTDS